MGRSQESFSKKEREKKKRKKKQEKLERKLERKANANKGAPLEEMLSYVDANGNLTSTPPPERKKSDIKLEDIQISVPKKERSEKPDGVHTGRITNFNQSKGYGFIHDDLTQESVFVHINDMIDQADEGARVSFKVKQSPKGFAAVEVTLAETSA